MNSHRRQADERAPESTALHTTTRPGGRAHQPPRDRDGVRRLRRGQRVEGARPHRLSLPPRRHGPADAGEHRRGRLPRHQGRQDRVLPQRRHPGAARGAGRRRRRLARRGLRARERRRAARRQAGHREVPAHADGPRRRGPLPQSRLSHLREPDRVPRRRRQALRLRPGRARLPARLRRDRGSDLPAHQAADLQQPPQPDGGGERGGGDRGAGGARPEARPVRALGRGLLGRALLRAQPVDRVASRHARADRHPVHVQQEVRDDGLAAWGRDRSGGPHRAHRHAERQPGVVHHPLHPVGRRRGAHRRPVGAQRRSCASSRSAATSPSSCSTRSRGSAAIARRRPSTCSRTSPG